MKKFRLHYWVHNDKEDGCADVIFEESQAESSKRDSEQRTPWASESWMAENIYLDEQGKLYFKKSSLSIREDGKRVYLEEIED